MRTIPPCIAIVRPHNIAAGLLSVGVGFSLAGPGMWPWMLLAAVGLVAAAGNVINDMYDIDIDRVNKPKKPLPSGSFPVRSARILYIVFLCLIAGLLPLLPAVQAGWIIAWVVLLHLYSARFKRMGLVGNLLVSSVTASGFLLGALAGGRIAAGILPASFTFLFVMGRELVKDCEDLSGDRRSGARTVPAVSGERTALTAASALFAILVVAFPLPAILGHYGKAYGIIMASTVLPILCVAIVLSLGKRSLSLVSLLLKLGMFFGIAAFYLAAVRSG